MKVVCERGSLLDALGLANGVVASRTPRPQLTCVHLDAGNGELTLAATDAEVALTARIGRVEVEQEGQTLVPAQKLNQIVSAEDNEPTLTLEASGDTFHVRGADAHFRLNTYPATDFPAAPDFRAAEKDANSVFTLTAGDLDNLITRTLFAAARENSRYAINGVLLNRAAKSLEMVATDGRRLARCAATLASADGNDASCILPAKALSLIVKLIDDPDEPVSVAISDAQAFVSFGDDPAESRAVLSTTLVEGSFPPYEDVIPKDHDIKVTFDRDVLASAVRRAALLTNEESRGVRMAFEAADKRLSLSSRAPEMGEANVSVDLVEYNGDDIEIGFNPQFITDALKVIHDPEVAVELKAPNKPGLFRSGSDFLYVVMPVNLQ